MSDLRPTGLLTPPRRILAAFLLLSAAVHATALIALSPLVFESGPSRTGTLEVVILSASPLPSEGGSPIADLRSAKRTGSVPARAASYDAPRTASEEHFADLPEPEPGDQNVVTLASDVPSSSHAKVSKHQPRPATAAATVPSFNAAYMSTPAPRYPNAARRAGEQGTVTLRVQVTREGTASHVLVDKSSGSPPLDAAALEAVKAWRFTPARRGGDTVESWMLVPIVFRLENAS